MAELRPFPLRGLAARIFAELQSRQSIFDLPRRKWFSSTDDRDLSVVFHGQEAATPLGPAAGPHTQMAQNIVLSWLAGCRIIELKTVQILDELKIPRPCIDMQTIGYNVEWSQELKLEESLEEYVKASMLIDILEASGQVASKPCGPLLFDMSVGYDLQGIQSERVQRFIDGMIDASVLVDQLRAELSGPLAKYRDLDFRTKLANSLTLSTFHGCPPDEIERIGEFLLETKGLHTIIKLNPTQLGPEHCRDLLNHQLGYSELRVPESAFANDATWEQATAFVDRLGQKAKRLGLGFGVKFSNTLIVENHRQFFPASEKVMYLSGQPLHVLAMHLVARFREHFADRFPISFSAGIDQNNFADAVALGLTPVTVCSDLLRPGGYARASGYLDQLTKRMATVGASNIEEYILRAYGLGQEALADLDLDRASPVYRRCQAALENNGDLVQASGSYFTKWLGNARLRNTAHYVAKLLANPRYHRAKNTRAPRKLGRHLKLFDCITCDKCVPVCPNHANFAMVIPPLSIPITKLVPTSDGFSFVESGTLSVEKKAQYANFADFCNECGNCDIFCPEEGGPYVVKPRLFGNRADWQQFAAQNGFYLDQNSMCARINGAEFELEYAGEEVRFRGAGFELALDPDNPKRSVRGHAKGEVDLTYYFIMIWIRNAILDSGQVNYLQFLRST